MYLTSRQIHRRKVRAWQMLSLLTPFAGKHLLPRIFQLLQAALMVSPEAESLDSCVLPRVQKQRTAVCFPEAFAAH